MPSKSLSSLLIISISLSLAAIAIIPIYREANAKGCSNNDDSSCSDKQGSNSNDDKEHSDHSVKKDKTPFVLSTPVPFP